LLAEAAWHGVGGGAARRAVIVDQLSVTAPNPEFAASATRMLVAAGYDVHYVRGEDVTVDFYRELPSSGYSLVILRSHSASRRTVEGVDSTAATIFTSEAFDQERHAAAGARLGVVEYDDGTPGRFFGVRPEFIEQDARGRFGASTVVVLMGCSGLRSARMAQAFVRRGAGTFVSWDRSVSVTETDRATLALLGQLARGAAVRDAVAAAMTGVGPDPESGARLTYYAR
jgi:hypothetical protein